MTTNSASYLTTLHHLLNQHFNLEDIRTLCFNLNVDYESVPGAEKQSRIRELLLALGRNDNLFELVTLVQNLRPRIAWPPVPDDFQLPTSLAVGDTAVPVNQYHYYGDVIQGDKIEGDKVAGHKIQIFVEEQVIVQRGEFIDLEQIPPEDGEPPYKGLTYFTEADADWFFGRETATTILINRLHDLNFLAIVGASGSGKSSAVRAGIVPVMQRTKQLADGSIPPLGEWQTIMITPTASPLDKLAVVAWPGDHDRQDTFRKQLAISDDALQLAVSKRLHKRSVLLVVDHFEELFTLSKDESQRKRFVANLVSAAQEQFKVIIVLRADFYPQCLRFDSMRQLLESHQAILGRMSREELREAILAPAAKGEWQIQEGLVEEMLDDVGDEPGALPLLSHALLETWQRRRGRILTLSGYREAGGVRGAIAKTAEAEFHKFTPTQQIIARNLFLRLTELGEDTPDTRRRADLTELIPQREGKTVTETVMQRLVNARLVTTDEGVAEVSHEALIREWPRLRGWLSENRERLRLRQRLADTAQEWQRHNREASYLYQGARLKAMTTTFSLDELDPISQEFIKTSRRTQRRRRLTTLGAASLLVTLFVLVGYLIRRQLSPWESIFTDNPVLSLASTSNTSNSIYYLATKDMGVGRSKDGTFWPIGNKGLPQGAGSPGKNIRAIYQLAVDPTDPNHLLSYVADSGAFVSQDGGASWFTATTGLPLDKDIFDLALYQDWGLTTLRDADGSQLYITQDGGANWMSAQALTCPEKAEAMPDNVTAVYIQASETAVYLGAVDGLYRNRLDSCWSWEHLAILPQVWLISATQETLYLGTSDPLKATEQRIYRWQGNSSLTHLTTVTNELTALAAPWQPQAGVAVFTLLFDGRVLAIDPDGMDIRLAQVPGISFDLVAVPHPQEDRVWLLLAHESGLLAFK